QRSELVGAALERERGADGGRDRVVEGEYGQDEHRLHRCLQAEVRQRPRPVRGTVLHRDAGAYRRDETDEPHDRQGPGEAAARSGERARDAPGGVLVHLRSRRETTYVRHDRQGRGIYSLSVTEARARTMSACAVCRGWHGGAGVARDARVPRGPAPPGITTA